MKNIKVSHILNHLATVIVLVVVAFQLNGCALTRRGEQETPALNPSQDVLEEKWGIKIEGIRTSAGGYMLDFRYRILDAEKALYLLDRKNKAYLYDQASGAKFAVPAPPKVGSLRQKVKVGKPKENRTYFILFANPGQYVKPGNMVTIEIGDFKVENLIVE